MDDKLRRWEIDMGPDTLFDCPDCEYYENEDNTTPHEFQEHLINEHGYSELEAKRIYHGW